MVNGSTLLLVREFLVLSIASSKPLPREVALTRFLSDRGQMIAVKSLATITALLLSDVPSVRPACDQESAEENSEVAITAVVEGVWLVPVRERPRVLMSKGCLISDLLVTVSPR